MVALRHDRVRDIVDTVFVTLDKNTLVAEAAKQCTHKNDAL